MLCGWQNAPAEGEPFPSMPGRAFEIKWDGYRLQALKEGNEVRILFGRSANDVTAEFPEFVEAMRRIPVDCILDGEALVLRDGWPHFQDFQNRMALSPAERQERLRFVAFDVLQFGTTDAMTAPYSERRKALEALVAPAAPMIFVGPSSTDGAKMWQFVLDHQLEGLIAKPLNSRYTPGARGTWTKIKRLVTETFTVVGYTPADTGKRAGWFGALIVAEPKGESLRACGAVGTGYNDDVLADLMRQLEPIKRTTPHETLLKQDLAGYKGVIWVEPVLKGRVTYSERTDYDTLRGPASWKGQVPA
jgi:bifunctional non-homologous end joining protein LigD